MKPRQIMMVLSHCAIVPVAVARTTKQIPERLQETLRRLHVSTFEAMDRYDYITLSKRDIDNIYKISLGIGLDDTKSVLELCSYLIGAVGDIKHDFTDIIKALQEVIDFYDPEGTAEIDYEEGFKKYKRSLDYEHTISG
jgi:hypothetical protein